MSKKILRGAAVGAGAFLVAVLLLVLGVLRPLEWKSWDLRLRLMSDPAKADSSIVLILLDQASLDTYEKEQNLPWPWPRQMYEAVVRYMKAGGAKAVFFDLILSEGSRYGVEDDETMSRAMREAGNVFLPFFLSSGKTEDPVAFPAGLEKFSRKSDASAVMSPLKLFSATLPVENLLDAAAGAGNVRFAPDADGIFRRIPLLFSFGGRILPALPLALADFVKGPQAVDRIPLDHDGNMIIRYRGPSGTYRTYSAGAVINSWARLEEGKSPQIDPKEFAGKIVLFGLSAPGLLDLKSSPLSAVISGTEIQAAALDNLLHGDFIRMASWPVLLIYILALCLLTAVGVSISRRIWKISIFFLICLALPAAASAAAFARGVWLEFAVPFLAVTMSFIGAALVSYGLEGRQRRFIKSVFKHYLSPDVIDRILVNPALLKLGGDRREISAFFSDVAGFTTLSERLSPEDLVNLLNAYLSEMTNVILETGGTLDKYEGDAIIAFWNAPLDQPDHARRGCRAALECQKRLDKLRPVLAEKYGGEIRMRIGVNSGPAVVGNMGSAKRFDYTAMGDTMNLAARLEGANKSYKTAILIGEETRALIGDEFLVREMDLLRVVGKKKPVRVFELVEERAVASPSAIEKAEIFQRGLDAYRRTDFAAALGDFQSLENDAAAAIYAERCRAFQAAPPPDDWDGVFILKEK